MDKLSAKERIEYLKKVIVENSKLYYENDAPKITDFEYDMMFKEFCELEERFSKLKTFDSPTVRVGGKALDKFDKFTHTVRMAVLPTCFPLTN